MPAAVMRCAALDHHTGYVWGASENLPGRLTDATATSMAAAQIMAMADGSRRYEPGDFELCERRDAAVALHVFAIGEALEIADGQDVATIAGVEAGRYLGSVRLAGGCTGCGS